MSPSDQARERLHGITSMLGAVIAFSIMDALMKRVSAHYGPLQVSCLRCFSSLVFLVPPIAWKGAWSTLRPAQPLLHLFRGALSVVTLGTFVFAVHRLTLAETYSLYLCAPLLMTALSVPILGEKVPARRWFAILFGLGGVLVILHPSGKGFGSLAALAAAASASCYAISALTVRSLSRTNSNAAMVFWVLLLASVGSGLLALGDWQAIVPGDWGWFAGIGVSGALGQVWVTTAFRRAPPSVVGPFEYTAILWAFAIDWIFWSASPTPALLMGAAIVIASGVFIIWDERRLAELALTPANPPP